MILPSHVQELGGQELDALATCPSRSRAHLAVAGRVPTDLQFDCQTASGSRFNAVNSAYSGKSVSIYYDHSTSPSTRCEKVQHFKV